MSWLKNIGITAGIMGGYAAYCGALYGINRFYDGEVPNYVTGIIIGSIIGFPVILGVGGRICGFTEKLEKTEESELIGIVEEKE